MSDIYSSDDVASPYTPDIERMARSAQSAVDAYPSVEKAAKLQRDVSDIKSQEMADTEPARNRQISRIRSGLSDIDAKYKAIEPVDVKPWNPDDHPIRNPLEAFGSYAGIFAMIASAATRQPVENTLNAGAAAINSVRNSDFESYRKAHEAFKENTDLAFKIHKSEQEDYQNAVSNMKAGKEGGDAELAAVSAKYGDKIVKAYFDAGMNKEALDIIDKRANAMEKRMAIQPQLQQLGQQQYETLAFQQAVKEKNSEREAQGLPRMSAQELVQLHGEMKDQYATGNEEKTQTRALTKRAVEEENAKRKASGQPPMSATEEAQLVGDTRRAATQSFGQFSASKQEEIAVEKRAAEIAKDTGKTIWESRIQAKQEMKDATASKSTREKVSSIDRAKDAWLEEHPEAGGVVPPSVENDIRAKANARAIASAEPSVSDKTAKLLAERVIAGDRGALSGLGYGAVGAANPAQVLNEVTEMAAAKGIDGATLSRMAIEYSATGRGAASLAQLEARTTGAITKAQATAPRVLEISDKVDRTRFPSVNSIILAAQKGTGGENVVRLGVAVETFINNYAMALGAGNSTMTDSSKQHARELLEKAYSKGQMNAAIDQMLIEMDSELAGIKVGMKQYLAPGHTPARATAADEIDPISVSTPEEAMTYPAGTRIVMPDGSRGVVPKEAGR